MGSNPTLLASLQEEMGKEEEEEEEVEEEGRENLVYSL